MSMTLESLQQRNKTDYEQNTDIQAKTPGSPVSLGAAPKVLFWHSEAEREGAQIVKRWCINNKVPGKMIFGERTVGQISKLVAEHKFDFVVVTSPAAFKQLVDLHKTGSQRSWEGSMIPAHELGIACPVLVLSSLMDIHGRRKEHTVVEWPWFLDKMLGKLRLYKGEYKYRLSICTQEDHFDMAWRTMRDAHIVTADIETNLNNFITSISFTPISLQGQIGHTFVLDWTVKSRVELAYLTSKKILEESPAIKCFHNGCFDTFMLMRWRIGTYNWLYDTEYMWHCWEAEARKSLTYVASLALPDYIYWKAESKEDMLRYNGKDSINTARVLLWLIEYMPAWAWHNYAQMLPILIPIVVSNLEGFAVDQARLAEARGEAIREQNAVLTAWAKVNGLSNLDQAARILNSPIKLAHVLYKVYGPVFGWSRPITMGAKKKAQTTGKLPSGTDSTSLKKLATLHPFAAKLVELILKWRKHSKAISTYYDSHLYGESKRMYYSLQPDGAKTGRLSCSASSLRLVTGCGKNGEIRTQDIKNYGSQIQNTPPYYKAALMADEGYRVFNFDKSKVEAHLVALISGDKRFTAAIHDRDVDFYLKLGDWFFGICTTDKEHPIRQVTKKINHATSYCMGWETFLDQVGIAKLYEFMHLVGWEGPKDPKVFIQYLLDGQFHGTFPGIKKWWGRTTKELIESGGYLVTPDGATRHFFKVPSSPRGISPNAVAHQPQHLSAITLNRIYAQVFYEVVLPSKMAVRLKAQVHDSIVGQVAVGEEHWLETIEEIMLRPYMTSLGPVAVPVDLEGPNLHWKEPKVKEKLAVVMEDEIDEGIIAG